MRPVTIHFRAGAAGKARVNELCLNVRHWRVRTDGITLRTDIHIVNCRRCRILYSRLWTDMPGEGPAPVRPLELAVTVRLLEPDDEEEEE